MLQEPVNSPTQLIERRTSKNCLSSSRVFNLVPGVYLCQEFFMSCTMTPVNRPTPMSTEVTYNWASKSQRTRMFAGCGTLRWNHSHIQAFWGWCLGAHHRHSWPRSTSSRLGYGWSWQDRCDHHQQSSTLAKYLNPHFQLLHKSTIPILDLVQQDDAPVMFMQTAPKVDEGTSLALAEK
jgi:hypothetical protein